MCPRGANPGAHLTLPQCCCMHTPQAAAACSIGGPGWQASLNRASVEVVAWAWFVGSGWLHWCAPLTGITTQQQQQQRACCHHQPACASQSGGPACMPSDCIRLGRRQGQLQLCTTSSNCHPAGRSTFCVRLRHAVPAALRHLVAALGKGCGGVLLRESCACKWYSTHGAPGSNWCCGNCSTPHQLL
jgi:hypothetical protein